MVEYKDWGSRFRAWGSGFSSLGFRVWVLGFMVWVFGLGFCGWGVELRVRVKLRASRLALGIST